jgi:hypothetical protein
LQQGTICSMKVYGFPGHASIQLNDPNATFKRAR